MANVDPHLYEYLTLKYIMNMSQSDKRCMTYDDAPDSSYQPCETLSISEHVPGWNEQSSRVAVICHGISVDRMANKYYMERIQKPIGM